MPSKILKTILRSGALLLAACSLASSVFAESEKPVYPADITDGTYSVDVKSSSSMFRVVDCKVTVSGDTMTAVMTMSGQGYGYVFMGTGEEALAAPESEYIPFELNADGQKTFTVPLEALDKTVQCAAWSIKKEQWYDRDLVFMSDTLPKDAVKRPSAVSVPVAAAVAVSAVAVAAGVTAALLRLRKNRIKK